MSATQTEREPERERARTQNDRDSHENVQKQQQTQKTRRIFWFKFFFSLLQPENRNTIFTMEKATTTDHIGIQTPNERTCTLKLVYEPISISFRSWYERPEREIAKHACMNVRYCCVLAVWMYRKFVVMAGAEWVEFQYICASCQSFLRPSIRSTGVNSEIVLAIKHLSEYYFEKFSRGTGAYVSQFR